MNITTKFNIGDKVFIIKDNKVKRQEILKIRIWVLQGNKEPEIQVCYIFDTYDEFNCAWEGNVYGSLEEMFEQIKSNFK